MRNKSWGRLLSLVLSAALVFSGSGLQALAAEGYAVEESADVENESAAEEVPGSSEASFAEDDGIGSDAGSAVEAGNENADVSAEEENASDEKKDTSDESSENAGSENQAEADASSKSNEDGQAEGGAEVAGENGSAASDKNDEAASDTDTATGDNNEDAADTTEAAEPSDDEALLEDAASAEDSIEPEVISDEDDPLFGVPIGEDEYYAVFVAEEDSIDYEDYEIWDGKYEVNAIGRYGFGHVEALAVGESLFLTGDEFVKKARRLAGWDYSVNGGAKKSLAAKATVNSSKLGAKAGDIVVFTAKWPAGETQYKLKLVTNGGTVKTGELRDKYTYSDPYTLPVMEKKGWIFWGWTEYNWSNAGDRDLDYKFTKVGKGAGVVNSKNNGEFGDRTLYAVYNRSYFNLVFNKNGGTINVPDTFMVPYDYTYNWTGVTYSKDGYKIKHWEYVDDDGNTQTIPGTSKMTLKNFSATGRDVTLNAIWEPLTYTITYSLGSGATIDKSAPKKYKPGSDTPLVDPKRTGYEFMGWTVDMKDRKSNPYTTARVNVNGDLSGTSYGNIILTAIWEEITDYKFKFVDGDNVVKGYDSVDAAAYSKTYDFTGIAGDISFSEAYSGKDLSVKGFALKKTDTKPKFKLNTSYKMADIVKNAGSNIDGRVITLYVITEQKKNFYSLVNGVTKEMRAWNYAPASGVKFKAPKVEGYTFTGWTVEGGKEGTDYTQNGADVTILKDAANGMIFTAVYETNKYKILIMPVASDVYASGSKTPIDAKGVYYKDGAEIEYSSDDLIEDPDWSKDGHELIGFAIKKAPKSSGDYRLFEGGLKPDKKGIVTLYAVWGPVISGLDYDYDGIVMDGDADAGTVEVDYKNVKKSNWCEYGKSTTLPSKIELRGYTFLGWRLKSNAEGADVQINSKGFATKIGPKNKADLEFAPVFKENTYTLKINPNGGEVNGNKKAYTLGTFKYSDDVKSAIEKEFGDRVLEDCYNNLSAFDDSKEKRVGYNFSRVALSANGKSTIYSGYYLGGNSNFITWVRYLSPKDKGTVTLYAVWYKVSAPSSAPVVKPILSSGTLYANADESYNHMQVQYSTDPKFKKNVITVDKERVYSDDYELNDEYYEDFNTIETDLTGNVYYVRARNAYIDSTGNFVFGPWSNIERASKTTDLPTTP